MKWVQRMLWRKRWKIRRHSTAFHTIYHSVNGFILSHLDKIKDNKPEYVYGEIVFEPFIALMSLCRPNTNTIFYDLGAGVGKPVLAMAMVFQVRASVGIECLPALHAVSRRQIRRLGQLQEYGVVSERIDFLNGDFLAMPIVKANLVFINATAFLGELWDRMSMHLETLHPGSQVVTISKPLKSEKYRLLHQTYVLMSWGVAHAFIQERIHA